MNIYVANLHYETTEQDLRACFERYGQVRTCAIIKDRETKTSKGFGFVEMDDDKQAQMAIETLNGAELDGRTLRVNESRGQGSRPSQYGGGRRQGGHQ